MKANAKTARGARALFRLCQVDGVADSARIRRVVSRLVSTRGRGALAVLKAFHRLVELDGRRRTAIVESALPLEAAVQHGFERDLRRKYGSALVTSFRHDPALIGGVRITVGSDVYDGSVRGRLAALEARL